jgi:hypothetical protein
MGRFVLLEHRWNGVHWDLMLEVGDALRTWAIDARIVPGADLPARSLPDHRIDYLDFEGDVSRGRGTVRRVDRGRYVRLVWRPEFVRVRLEGCQLSGEAEIRRVDTGLPETPFSWTFRLGNFD